MVKKIELKMIGKASTWEIQISEDMIVWASGVTSDDYQKKWTGDKGYIDLMKPFFAKGLRFIFKTTDTYIGLAGITIYKQQWTVMIQNKWDLSKCVVR